ncbi:MAG TPA: FtsX-like permease family protein [Spirochaetia bacterium]|nr:FtsX-like permease family protein [Spirochaetia bacterium]
MKTLSLAWRNLLRQKRRTLITLSALIVGMCGLVVFQGYIVSLMNGFRESTIRSGLGHLQVAKSAGYFEDGEFNPYAFMLPDSAGLAADLSQRPGVLAVFPSTGFTSIAGAADKSVTLLVKGYPAERMYFAAGRSTGSAQTPRDRFGLGTLVAGAAPGPGDRDRLVLGETAARILGVQPGSVVTLMAVLPDGGLNGRDFTVEGIYRDPGRDKVFAFTDYDTAADFTGVTSAPVVHVLAADIAAVGAIRTAVPAGLAVRTWHDLATYYVQVNTMFGGFLGVIRIIILLVTLFIMANTMNRIVRERMREWGTLRAMGMKKRRILLLVVLEGGLQGVVGAALGVLAGLGLSALINLQGGLPVPFANGGQRVVVRLLLSAQPAWNLVPAALFAAAASLLPGLRATRLTPSECLRQV